MLRSPGMGTQEHCNAFFSWLKNDVGIQGHANTIVHMVAEKVNTMMPGTFNEADLEHS